MKLILIGIDIGSRGDIFRRMDAFEKGHSGPVGAKVSECSQLESLYAVSYLFEIGV
jgi:hypothetical protein